MSTHNYRILKIKSCIGCPHGAYLLNNRVPLFCAKMDGWIKDGKPRQLSGDGVMPSDCPLPGPLDRVPKGYQPMEAYTNGKEIVVLGEPDDGDDLTESSHNCDAMGCSSVDHVILRIPHPFPTPTTEAKA